MKYNIMSAGAWAEVIWQAKRFHLHKKSRQTGGILLLMDIQKLIS
jgi:hypothetical protein